MHPLSDISTAAAPAYARRADYLPALVKRLDLFKSEAHRYLLVAHLFDDTRRMIDALEGVMDFDAIIGIPYSLSFNPYVLPVKIRIILNCSAFRQL